MSLGVVVFLILLIGKLGFGWDISTFQVFLPLILEAALDVLLIVLFFVFGKKIFKWMEKR